MTTQVERLPRWSDQAAARVEIVHAPTHLLGWLPIVWTRALFSGTPLEPTALRWRSFTILFLLTAAVLYPCLSFHLFEPDEGRYAQIPREMLERGEWLVPSLQGEPYLDKPPLFYWLVMLSYAVFGYHDWAARLVPALAIQATVLLTYALSRRIVGERSAYWGALLLTASPLFLGVGRLLLLDGLLTLFVSIALLFAYPGGSGQRGRWLLAAAATGLGVLTKGPVAIVLVVPPLVMWRWLATARSCGLASQVRTWLVFLGIVLAINLPWYLAVCVRRPEFAGYFLLQHNVQRFVEPFDHVQPVWFYVPILLYGLLPIILLAWSVMRFMTSTQAEESGKRCPGMGYLLLAGCWCVLFFSLAGSKLPTYVLPAFPPLLLVAGCFVARTKWAHSRWLIGMITLAWLVQVVVSAIAVPAYARLRSPMADVELMHERCGDPSVPVVCFPRHVDSVAFYTGRSDFRTYRSKDIDALVRDLEKQPRTVILFGHRNSPETLDRHLPRHLRMIERRPMGLCESSLVFRTRN